MSDFAMQDARFNWVGVACVLLAMPIWILICYEASLSTGFGFGNGRYVMPPFVLGGLTVAISRLLRPQKHTWPLSMLLAGIGALSVLMWAAG